MNKTALLIGGLGLGAGLIYMLDSERGERRRAMVRAQLERYRRQTDDLWGHTTRSLGRQAHALLARGPLARRYRRPGPRELLLARAEQLSTWTKVLPQFTLLENQSYISFQTVGESLRPLRTDVGMTHKPKMVANNTL